MKSFNILYLEWLKSLYHIHVKLIWRIFDTDKIQQWTTEPSIITKEPSTLRDFGADKAEW